MLESDRQGFLDIFAQADGSLGQSLFRFGRLPMCSALTIFIAAINSMKFASSGSEKNGSEKKLGKKKA